jgi:hypothetical protein
MLFSLQMGVSSAEEKVAPHGEGFTGVHFGDGRLRVSIENEKLQKVMGEIAQKAGIRIVINGSADEYLTIHFDYLPLEKGLKKLLRGRNYVFVYFPEEPSQVPTVKQVLVFPKSEETIAANMKGSTESRSVLPAGHKETRERMQNVDQKSLEQILEVFSQSGIYINEEMIREIGDLEEIGEEFSKALEIIQKMEGFEQLVGFEGKAEISLAPETRQKGPAGEMQNVDQESIDEVLKTFSEGERELDQ